MAQERQAQEQRDSDLSSCLRDAGYVVEVLPGSAIRTAADDLAAQEAIARCAELHEGPDGVEHPSDDQLRTWYERAVDTRSCLVARGYTISEPPSLESWLEQQANPGQDGWIPFGEAIDQMTGASAAEEYAATFSACPQQGVTAAAAFPE